MPITFNLLLTELDKDRFVKGEKGMYANLVLYETEGKSAEYGDYIVKQQGEEGDRMPILGNGKYWKPKRRDDDRGERRGGRYRYQGRSRRRDDYDPRPSGPQQRERGGDEDEIPF